jgi:hypothetical protein
MYTALFYTGSIYIENHLIYFNGKRTVMYVDRAGRKKKIRGRKEEGESEEREKKR